MEQHAQLKVKSAEVIPKLALWSLRQEFRCFDLYDYALTDQHVAAVETDWLRFEVNGDGVFAVYLNALVSKDNLKGASVDRFQETETELVVNFEERPDYCAAKVRVDQLRVAVRGIRMHPDNPDQAVLGSATKRR